MAAIMAPYQRFRWFNKYSLRASTELATEIQQWTRQTACVLSWGPMGPMNKAPHVVVLPSSPSSSSPSSVAHYKVWHMFQRESVNHLRWNEVSLTKKISVLSLSPVLHPGTSSFPSLPGILSHPTTETYYLHTPKFTTSSSELSSKFQTLHLATCWVSPCCNRHLRPQL